MQLIADTHVHLYDQYNPEQLLAHARQNLRKLAPNADAHLLCIADRVGFSSFKALYESDAETWGGASLSRSANILRLETPDQPPLLMLACRQMQTAERLEMLAMGTFEELPDQLSLEESLAAASEAAPLAVLPWAFGKWLFKREKTIQNFLEKHSSNELVIGDSALRPHCLPTPRLLKNAQKSGYTVLAGTDPLPVPGEEQWIGTFGDLLKAEKLTEAAIVTALKHPEPLGRRNTLLQAVQRVRSYNKG